MARRFNGSSDKLLATGGAAVTAYPLSFAAWVRTNDTAGSKSIVSVGRNNNDDYAALYLPSSENLSLIFRLNSTLDRDITGSAPVSTTQWTHCVGTIDASRVPRVYVNGTLSGTGTDGGAGSFGALSQTAIGVREVATDDWFFDGDIAEVAAWNRQLSQGEITALAKGFSPTWFLSGLTFYQDLIRGLNRPGKGPSMTETGTTVIAHPPKIVYPYRRVFANAIPLPNLHLEIDEETPSAVDYIKSRASPNADLCEIAIDPFTLPQVFTFAEVEYRYRRFGPQSQNLTVKLMSGSIEIASWTHTNVSDTAQRTVQSLSQAQINQIGTPPNLRLRFIASAT